MPDQPETKSGGAPGADQEEGSVSRTLVSGGLWNLLSTIFPIVTSILMTPYVIHGFGVNRWGLYILVLTISTFLGPVSAGINGTVNRYLAVYAGRGDRVKATETVVTMLAVLTVFGLVITAIGWVLSPVVIGWFGVHGPLTAEGVFLLRTLGILITVGLIQNQFDGVMASHHRWATTNSAWLGASVVWAAGLVSCVHFHWGLRGVAFVFVGQQALPMLVLIPAALRYLSRDGVRFLSRAELGEMLRFGISVQAVGLIDLFNNTFDTLLVGGVFRVRTLAYFNSGQNFATQLREVPMNLAVPAGTHLARVYGRDGDDAALEAFGVIQHIWVVVTTGFTFVSMGAAYFAVVAWLGPSFSLAGKFALILMAGNTTGLWVKLLAQYMAAVGRPDLEMRYTIVSIVINASLTIPLAFVSVLGIPIATALGAILANPYFVHLVRKRYRSDVPHFLREVPFVPGLLGAAVTVLLELLIKPVVPGGAPGLVCCGLPAAVGLAVFTVAVLRHRTPVLVRLLLARQFALGPIALLFLDDHHSLPTSTGAGRRVKSVTGAGEWAGADHHALRDVEYGASAMAPPEGPTPAPGRAPAPANGSVATTGRRTKIAPGSPRPTSADARRADHHPQPGGRRPASRNGTTGSGHADGNGNGRAVSRPTGRGRPPRPDHGILQPVFDAVERLAERISPPESVADDADTRYIAPGRSALLHWRLCAGLAVIGLVIGGLYAAARTPKYNAEAQLFVGKTLSVTNTASIPGLSYAATQIAGDYARLALTHDFKLDAGRRLGHANSLGGTLSATQIPNSPQIRMDATADSAAGAVALANAGSAALVDSVNQLNSSSRAQLAGLLSQYTQLETTISNNQQQVNALKAQNDPAATPQIATLQTEISSTQLQANAVQDQYQSSYTPLQAEQQVINSLGPATDNGNDRKKTLELAGLVGIVVGMLLGVTVSSLADLRATRRRRATPATPAT